MPATPKHVPEGYHTLTPYLIVDGAARAIAFYQKAFGATEVMRIDGPAGKVGHAEIAIGESRLMLADEYPEMEAYGPKHFGGSPVTLHLYVDDADAWVARAVAAGATIVRPVAFGYRWWLATRKETLLIEELRRRSAAYLKQQKSGSVPLSAPPCAARAPVPRAPP